MATNLEEARGKDIVVRFDTQRCIHARHCVLGHPAVFQANMQGPWIDPEAASPERTAAVVQACPSGALSYERLDGGLQESPPLVNVIRIRENGPLAVVADLRIVNEAPMIRATLCRCGRSKNKPFCDSAHVAMGFKASGEPPSNGTPALAHRGGLLELVPLKDGPLQLNGNVELCTGTGRTITRLQETYSVAVVPLRINPFAMGPMLRLGSWLRVTNGALPERTCSPRSPAKAQRFRGRSVSLRTSLPRAAPKVGGGRVDFAADDEAL